MSIKHLFRDSLITALCLFGVVWVYRRVCSKRGSLVRVVVFHDVEDREWFKKTLDMMVRNFNIITPQQFHSNELDPDKINILVTFDDGYRSWVDTCLPVLDSCGVKAIFFINSGLLECAENTAESAEFMKTNLMLSPKEPLTWEGAQKIAARGHTVGGHTKNHPNITALSEELAVKEIMEDKHLLESNLGVKIVDFAYPFGTRDYFNWYVAQIVSKNGFYFGYTAISSFVSMPATENFFIPRTCIEKNQSLTSIQMWVEGGYDLFTQMKTD